jgi:hypothetical protein
MCFFRGVGVLFNDIPFPQIVGTIKTCVLNLIILIHQIGHQFVQFFLNQVILTKYESESTG